MEPEKINSPYAADHVKDDLAGMTAAKHKFLEKGNSPFAVICDYKLMLLPGPPDPLRLRSQRLCHNRNNRNALLRHV